MSDVKQGEGRSWRVVRAVFSCPGSGIDDIVADLILDHNRHWVEKPSACGWWGKEASDDVWPFILKKGGILDFGANPECPSSSDERFASFAINGKPLRLGESYHFAYCDIAANFKLVSDLELASFEFADPS
ncbi:MULTISPECIES: hypothetical protein [unclassified Sphingobium]|uniref:hypothetical protein n=1 Tax=unclassified Sphingobium TaxID=2611147 RepID=UPI0022243B1E|nr:MULTISPECIES: hypothetical protein [unclassified Sphingobium]MCW2413438.1 hypothetical protein [Sphingobium sp. B8D3D]MCW2414263.1 hypothetical protein [Sphingobium sp. B8D3A]